MECIRVCVRARVAITVLQAKGLFHVIERQAKGKTQVKMSEKLSDKGRYVVVVGGGGGGGGVVW